LYNINVQPIVFANEMLMTINQRSLNWSANCKQNL